MINSWWRDVNNFVCDWEETTSMFTSRGNMVIFRQFSNIVCPGTKNAKDLLGDLLSEDPELLRDVNLLLEDEVKFKS